MNHDVKSNFQLVTELQLEIIELQHKRSKLNTFNFQTETKVTPRLGYLLGRQEKLMEEMEKVLSLRMAHHKRLAREESDSGEDPSGRPSEEARCPRCGSEHLFEAVTLDGTSDRRCGKCGVKV